MKELIANESKNDFGILGHLCMPPLLYVSAIWCDPVAFKTANIVKGYGKTGKGLKQS